jgi:hypothetical protein
MTAANVGLPALLTEARDIRLPTAATPQPGPIPLCVSLPPSPSCRTCRLPHESLDAPEDLPKERPGQAAFGQLEDDVSGMSKEAPSGPEEASLAQAGQSSR